MRALLDKSRLYLRGVKDTASQLQKSIAYFSIEEEKQSGRFEKYDRFLRDNQAQQDHQPALLKTLTLIENS